MIVLAIIIIVIAAVCFVAKVAGLNSLNEKEDRRRESLVEVDNNREIYIQERYDTYGNAGKRS